MVKARGRLSRKIEVRQPIVYTWVNLDGCQSLVNTVDLFLDLHVDRFGFGGELARGSMHDNLCGNLEGCLQFNLFRNNGIANLEVIPAFRIRADADDIDRHIGQAFATNGFVTPISQQDNRLAVGQVRPLGKRHNRAAQVRIAGCRRRRVVWRQDVDIKAIVLDAGRATQLADDIIGNLLGAFSP